MIIHQKGEDRSMKGNRLFGQFKLSGVFGIALLAAVLSSCGGAGNPLPTPRPAEEVGAGAKSQAKGTYQETWDSYLRDAIAADNQVEDIKISMLQRYQKPSSTKANLGGILKKTDLLEDRTKLAYGNQNTTASGLADFDVKMTFANGDTDTRHCKVQVSLELNPDDKLWYVVNPGPMAVFSNCTKS